MRPPRKIIRGAAFSAFCTSLLLTTLVLLPARSPPRPLGAASPVVTLASTASRLLTTLPITLESLVAQSLPPSSINVFLPLDAAAPIDALTASGTLAAIFYHPLVRVHFVEDQGPATKLIPVLEQLLVAAKDGDASALEERVVVVDDDHAYSPVLLSTLVDGFERLKRERDECRTGCVVGLRGWRLRSSLHWGVLPGSMWRHVIEGAKIRSAYRVAVLTANEAYLVLPRFFLSKYAPSILPTSYPLSNYTDAPPSAHLVDDVWIASHLSTTLTPRFVVPLQPKYTSIDLTTDDHPLERHMKQDGVLRDKGNTAVLRWARKTWELEEETVSPGETIWWDWDPAGRDPKWRGVWARVERAWGRRRMRRWVDSVS